MNRLVRAEVLPQAGAPSDTRADVETFAYDPFGNMLSRTLATPRSDHPAERWTHGYGGNDGASNRNRITDAAFTYGLNGNAQRLTGKSGDMQPVGGLWDDSNRMVQFVEGDPRLGGAPAESYRFDGADHRWYRNGRDGQPLISLRDAAGQPSAEYVVQPDATLGSRIVLDRQYVSGLGQVLAERRWNGTAFTTTFHHRDHLGSVRIITDASGAIATDAAGVAERHDYYPFGGEMGPVASSSRKKFTGHERDEETGLDYMLARYYPASLGRFLSVDTGAATISAPNSWNRYAYTLSNPLTLLDADGRAAFNFVYMQLSSTATSDLMNQTKKALDVFSAHHVGFATFVKNIDSAKATALNGLKAGLRVEGSLFAMFGHNDERGMHAQVRGDHGEFSSANGMNGTISHGEISKLLKTSKAAVALFIGCGTAGQISGNDVGPAVVTAVPGASDGTITEWEGNTMIQYFSLGMANGMTAQQAVDHVNGIMNEEKSNARLQLENKDKGDVTLKPDKS